MAGAFCFTAGSGGPNQPRGTFLGPKPTKDRQPRGTVRGRGGQVHPALALPDGGYWGGENPTSAGVERSAWDFNDLGRGFAQRAPTKESWGMKNGGERGIRTHGTFSQCTEVQNPLFIGVLKVCEPP